MTVKSYRDLEVWQEAMKLVEQIYRLGETLPAGEKFNLTSQIQRAALSVPANIAEGHGRTHRGDYLRHLSIARGSLMEVETYLELAVRLSFVERESVRPPWESAQKIGKMLNKLIQALKK